jgi:hypothetical protein
VRSRIASDLDEVTHQDGADASSLPGINDDERHLGPPQLEDDVSPTSDNYLPAGLLCQRHQRDMIAEVDVHEESALLIREMALHREEAALQRFRAGLCLSSEHRGLVLRPKGPDFDRAAVTEAFQRAVVGSVRHGALLPGGQAMISLMMKPSSQ